MSEDEREERTEKEGEEVMWGSSRTGTPLLNNVILSFRRARESSLTRIAIADFILRPQRNVEGDGNRDSTSIRSKACFIMILFRLRPPRLAVSGTHSL